MIRHDTYGQTGLTERVEIERLDPSTVEYNRFDSDLVLVETRPATPDEIELVDNQIEFEDREQKQSNVEQAVDTLRQWAIDSAGTTVTDQNNTAVTQQIVDRLGVFFDRFADLIESKLLN